ncbi:MAG: TerD family protein [Frankiales bacterium]|nr:TerD family protein [Frankiales bacterium]
MDDQGRAGQEPSALTRVVVGLGWDASDVDGAVDASALLLGPDGLVLSDQHVVFFNNPATPDGTVQHLGEGAAGAVDRQQFAVDLGRMEAAVDRIAFVVSRDQGATDLHGVRDLSLRLVDADGGAELTRYDHVHDPTHEGAAVLLGVLSRTQQEWAFRAFGRYHPDGLAGVVREAGVEVD